MMSRHRDLEQFTKDPERHLTSEGRVPKMYRTCAMLGLTLGRTAGNANLIVARQCIPGAT